MTHDQNAIEKQFIKHLRHHLQGWQNKVLLDFSEESFFRELAALKSDPVYPKFHLDSPEYVNIRLIGRMSISIGRRLGEIYDKIPRLLAAARFGLTPEQVAPKFDGLELDIGLRFDQIGPEDSEGIRDHCSKHLSSRPNESGIGIEIRYNFNPNDSSRLRKDVDMASRLTSRGLYPVYLVFSSISPRDEAISRLSRAGWNFLVGQPALDFMSELLGTDITSILDRPSVSSEIKQEIDNVMASIKQSYAFRQF
jgi:hypothetical protein